MIALINFIPFYMHGAIVTLTDTANEVKKHFNNSQLYIKCLNEWKAESDFALKTMIFLKKLLCIKNYTLFDSSIDNDIIDVDTAITVYWTLPYINWRKVKAKNLIILDSLDMHIANDNGVLHAQLDNIRKYFDNIYILANPFVMTFLKRKCHEKIEYIEYFSKISADRVEKCGNCDKIDQRVLVRNRQLCSKYNDVYVYDKRNERINTLSFSKHAFARIGHGPKEPYYFVENIGKLLFEYMYLGRQPDYYPLNKQLDDGLHFYLQMLDIDDNVENLNINVPKSKLLGTVFFDENDALFDLLRYLGEKQHGKY